MTINWQPTAEIATLKRRAQYLADIRLFFAQQDVWEVETPILSQAAPTAPYLDSFTTCYSSIGSKQQQTYYLHPSPEFSMKRLLAAESGSIYQIAKVFRNGEWGKFHSPEFTMLEWYRTDFTLSQLMAEVTALLQQVFSFKDFERLTYCRLFKQYLNINVLTCPDDDIQHCARQNITSLPADFDADRDGWLELLMSDVMESQLGNCTFVYDYPPSQAQLATIVKDQSGNEVADRFELYIDGVELANGYNELLDADKLYQRFASDNQQRRQQNKPIIAIDENLLAAMQSGLPPCSGVALGLDRLMMLAMDKQAISQILSFSFEPE